MTLARTAFARKAPSTEPKPAKGPRTRKCRMRGCSGRVTLDPTQPFMTWCSVECGASLAMATITARKLKAAKADRAVTKAKKETLKRRADHIADAQTAFNAFCRERDRAQQCISCDESLWRLSGITGGNFDCGHFRSRGSAPHLRFHESNAHGQCKRCNRYLSGNVTEYRPRLIARIGLAAVEALEADQEPRRWTVDELIAIKTLYRAKLRALTNSRSPTASPQE